MNRGSCLAAWSRRPRLVVATVGLIAGLGFVLLTPPLTGYDEPYHFLRAYQVSEGHLLATQHGRRLGGAVPAELPDDLGRLLTDGMFSRDHTKFLKHVGDPPARGRKRFVDFAPSAVYAPVSYAPAALLMAIGRAIGASTLVLMYLGRLGSLLATIGILSLAVGRMPARKWMLATVGLLPVTLLQASTLSADGVTIALALLVLALALDVAATPRGEVTKGRLVEIVLATVALGFAKPPYVLLALAFGIAMRRHGRDVVRVLVASVAAGIAATAAWGAYASSVYVPPNLRNAYRGLKLGTFTAFTHVDPDKQERFVLHHPWSFVRAIGRTLTTFWPDLVRQTFAQVPLWQVPPLVVVAAVAIVSASVFVGDPRPDLLLGWRSRALLLLIALTTFVALMLLAYTGWNAVGSPRIDAFQGRYLLPLLPIVFVAVVPDRWANRIAAARHAGVPLSLASGLLLAFVWFGLRSHFY